jgi:AbrB family looped-hinge helix DNA binding protein
VRVVLEDGGRLRLPAEVWRQVGVRAGDRVEILVVHDTIVLRPVGAEEGVGAGGAAGGG